MHSLRMKSECRMKKFVSSFHSPFAHFSIRRILLSPFPIPRFSYFPCDALPVSSPFVGQCLAFPLVTLVQNRCQSRRCLGFFSIQPTLMPCGNSLWLRGLIS